MIQFKFLIENKTDHPGLVAEHGLSIYIEVDGKKLLFDTGASALYAENAKKLGIRLEEVEGLVISHGHYDHTEGVPHFCRINQNAPVYIHKEAFEETYGIKNGKLEEKPCSILWDEEERNSLDPRITCTEGPLWLSEDIVISGTLPDVQGQNPTETFFIKTSDGTFVKDKMNHEQILVIRQKEGLYIFSGCSHKGILPVIACARRLFPGARIAALIAGLHLYSAGADERKKVVEKIIAEEIDKVIPVHCTGIHAICDLKTALGDRCIAATTGDSYGYR